MVVVLATPFPPDPSVVESDDESNALVVSLLLPGLAGSTVDGALGLLAAPPLKLESCSEAFGFLLGRPPLSKSSLVDSDDESNALVVSLLLPGLAGSAVDDARGPCAAAPLMPESCGEVSGFLLVKPPPPISSVVDSDDESNALVVSLLLPGLTGSTIDDARVLCAVLCAVSPVLPETCCVASGLV